MEANDEALQPSGGKSVKYKQTKILVNEEGKLLDHDGFPLDLKYPMTSAERKQLLREMRELL
jgi:hypothetical protein